MVLHNAADSLADLLQIKHEREKLTAFVPPSNSNKNMGGLSSAKDSISSALGGMAAAHRDSVSDMMRSGRPKTSKEELDELNQEEDDAPVWEMDQCNDGHLHLQVEGNASSTFADEDGNVYSAVPKEPHRSMAECERIFTVPEVLDDILMGRVRRRNGWLCNLFGHCLSGRESHKRCKNAFKSPITGQETIDLNEEDNITDRSQDEKLKRMSLAVQLFMNMPATARKSFNPSLYKVRLDIDGNETTRASIVGDHHQIFGSGYGSIPTERHHCDIPSRHVHFSELKRVLKVRKFTQDEASDVWYQREDFAHFKAEMTLLIRDMEASKELAALWLDSEESAVRRSSESTDKLNESNGSKTKKAWWHDYDHSRRGLERYASPGQARQILASYKVALHKVFALQRQQMLLQCLLPCIPVDYNKNADRIAEIYHEYTAWSSDLALAAGASDADAVRTNFDDETRKTREYYILKQVIGNGYRVHKHMPEFMMPKCITPKGFLDESETLLGTHYCDLDRTRRRRESIMERANKAVRGGTVQTGEEAREEMSHLTLLDLNGPIAPALAPMLDVKGAGDDASSASMSPQHGFGKRQQSLAAKAKNYPFQQ